MKLLSKPENVSHFQVSVVGSDKELLQEHPHSAGWMMKEKDGSTIKSFIVPVGPHAPVQTEASEKNLEVSPSVAGVHAAELLNVVDSLMSKVPLNHNLTRP